MVLALAGDSTITSDLGTTAINSLIHVGLSSSSIAQMKQPHPRKVPGITAFPTHHHYQNFLG